MKGRLRHYLVSFGATPGKVLFFVGGMDLDLVKGVSRDLGLWNGEAEEKFSEPDSRWGGCWDLGCNQVVWLFSFVASSPEDLGMLTHEVNHAVFNRAEHLGFKLSDDSCEHYCYEAEYLVGCFVDGVKSGAFEFSGVAK